MLWPKLKNVILALLLITNMFLLALVLSQEVKLEEEEQEARRMAIEFMNERGILVRDTVVPEEIRLIPQEMSWNRDSEEVYAYHLLGEVESQSLGGDIVRYFNEDGELRFHDNGEFYATFSSDFFPVMKGQEEEIALEVLDFLDFQGRLLEVTHTEQWSTLVFLQEFDGIPLLGCEVRFLFEGNYLKEISQGKRLQGEFLEKYESNITVATALVQCYKGFSSLEVENKEILEIQESYMVATPLTSSATLTPGWKITTDIGVYFLDTLTGELERWN